MPHPIARRRHQGLDGTRRRFGSCGAALCVTRADKTLDELTAIAKVRRELAATEPLGLSSSLDEVLGVVHIDCTDVDPAAQSSLNHDHRDALVRQHGFLQPLD